VSACTVFYLDYEKLYIQASTISSITTIIILHTNRETHVLQEPRREHTLHL